MPESLMDGWVNITGMVGQHKTEWWVNMLRNLHSLSLLLINTPFDTALLFIVNSLSFFSYSLANTLNAKSFLNKNATIMETQTPAKNETRIDVYKIVNERIMEQLEKGTVPWRQPWTDAGLPMNIISKRHYRGINMLLLAMERYEHNLFISFKQVKEIGGNVKKGEKGHMVVYWNQVENKPDQSAPAEGTTEGKRKAILRYYRVFNIAQCENIPEKYLPKEREASELPTCEAIVNAMPQCPPVKHKEQSAYYNFKEDFVNMPKKRSFKNDESYYCTLFHELVHSTGHESRLKRETLMQMAEFGGEVYSLEELIAEMGTCYLQSFAGITGQFQQSAAYIKGWLGKLKGDKRFIFQASKAAQRATDFILNIKYADEEGLQNEEE